jgi:hypothetical protein
MITLKNPSLSTEFEPINFGSNGKHDNHYATKINQIIRKQACLNDALSAFPSLQ